MCSYEDFHMNVQSSFTCNSLNQEQYKCPSVGECWCVHRIQCYSAVKWNELDTCNNMSGLQNNVRERSQIFKSRYSIIPFMQNYRTCTLVYRHQCPRGRGWGREGVTFGNDSSRDEFTLLIMVVSVYSGWYNKVQQTRWLINNRNVFLTVLKSWSLR